MCDFIQRTPGESVLQSGATTKSLWTGLGVGLFLVTVAVITYINPKGFFN